MINIKHLVLIVMFCLPFSRVLAQLPNETTNKPKVVIPPPENKGPSLLQPKEKKAFLSEVRVFDDEGKLVGANRWNLATGVKATYIIVKEK